MSEIKIITSGPAQIYQDGKLLAGTSSGGSSTPGTYPPDKYPAGAPPTADASYTMPWPNNQDKAEFTLGQHTQTVRLIVPAGFSTKGKHGWIKVFGYPSGSESFLNSRMIKNNIIQRAWYAADALSIQLQEDFVVAVPEPNVPPMQLWMPGDIIDFQFKTQAGNDQPVRCEVFTGEL